MSGESLGFILRIMGRHCWGIRKKRCRKKRMPWTRVCQWSWSEVAGLEMLAMGLAGEKEERPRRGQFHFLIISRKHCLPSLTGNIKFRTV